ncbi:thioredoxin [bacterium]|nr:thioredoxin [bacterium]
MELPAITQSQFEDLWDARGLNPPPSFLVWFGASWCRPCHRLDLAAITAAAAAAHIPLWYCDAAVNKYTPGYANVYSLPTFVYYKPGREVTRITSADTKAVISWIHHL